MCSLRSAELDADGASLPMILGTILHGRSAFGHILTMSLFTGVRTVEETEMEVAESSLWSRRYS